METHFYRHWDEDFTLGHSMMPQPDQDHFKLHTHPKAELYYLVSGSGIFHIEGSAYPLEPGDLLIMQPLESHYIQLDLDQPYDRIALHFNMNILQSVDPHGTLLSPLLNRPLGKQNLYKPFRFRGGSCRHYFDIMMHADPDPRVCIFAGLIPLLLELRGLQAAMSKESELAPDTTEYRILRYLSEHIDENITLQDICDKFFISRSQLCRIFRNATGVTVKHYQTAKRLTLARTLMDAGEAATHVYSRCGFSDYSSFYRAYVKYYGTAPSRGK